MEVTGVLLQGGLELVEGGDGFTIYFVNDEVALFLVTEVERIRQNLSQKNEGWAFFGWFFVVVIDKAEGSTTAPLAPPASEVSVGKGLKDKPANNQVFGCF